MRNEKGQFIKGHGKGEKRTLSDITRAKISNSLKGKTVWNKGKKGLQVAWNKGKTGKKQSQYTRDKRRDSLLRNGKMQHGKRSEETRRKISNAKMGSIPWNKGLYGLNSGEKAINWKGGLTPESKRIRNSCEYIFWRKQIYIRDNFTCTICNEHGGRLNAHHINNFADFPELRFVIDNGITMCKKCHKEFHKTCGKQNNTKEQLDEFRNTYFNTSI
jgi:hypothetical protein